MTCPPPSAATGAGGDPFERARRRGRSARTSLDAAERDRARSAVTDALCALDVLATPSGTGRVGLSRPIRDEIDVSGTADELRSRGWTVWLPVVGAEPSGPPTMAFRRWDAGDELVAGAFGIEEPPDDGRTAMPAGELTVVVAPCVAVDAAGTRVGFGAGYYDRALADVDRRPVVVVAAFDVQVLDDELPRRRWDVPAEVVVTERRTWRPGT